MKKLITIGLICAITMSMWALETPQLVSPNDDDPTANYYPTQTLRWTNIYGTTSYKIEIDTVPTFDSPAKHCEQGSNSNNKDSELTHSVSNLYLGCFNYWRLKIYNANDSSDWSETFRFHTLSKAKATSPNGLTTAYTKQTLEWKFYKGLTKAIIEIDTTAQFNSPAKNTYETFGSNQDNCYYEVANLFFGTTYYWRVATYHAKDTTDWSDPLSFTTYNFCTLSAPADSSINRYTSGKVYWRYSKGISRYQVQLDTVPTFDSPILINVIESAGSDDYAYYSYSQLYFGQWYYWRVRECHTKDTSAWSQTRHFKTYRHCNLSTSPADSATNIITSPDLYFSYSTGVTYYQQQIDTTPAFNSPLCETKIEKGSPTDSYNYHTFYDLRFGTRYFRRVRECLPKDTSDWSPIRSFTTIATGAYSTSYSIAKGATDQSINPLLYYYYRSYIDSVEIQLDTTLNFNSPLLEIHRVKEASSQSNAYIEPYKSLLYGTTYYWRIRDIHAKDISGWTTPRYFTTAYMKPALSLVSPTDLSVIITEQTPIDFTWHTYHPTDATILDYTMQLSTTISFEEIFYQAHVNDTVTSFLLPMNTTLYWRVCGNTTKGRTAWSTPWLVTTKDSSALCTLETPTFTKPENSPLANAYTRQYFNWTAVADAANYILQIDTTTAFNSPELIQTVYTTNGSNNVIYDLRYGTHYYYRMRAMAANQINRSAWTEAREFITVSRVTLSSPNDPEVEYVYYPSLTLYWKNSIGSTSYKIEIDTVPTFDSPAILRYNQSSSYTNQESSLSQSVSNLMLGKMNYWRVRAYNDKDSSDWSIPMCFKTYNNAKGTAPADSLTNAYTQQTLRWECINGLPNVIIELDTTASFNSTLKQTINEWAYYSDDASTTVSQLLFGTTYYWRVRYYHSRDTTQWSKTRHFTTYYRGLQGNSPANGATDVSVNPTLWVDQTNYISTYLVQIDTARTFDSQLLRKKTLTTTSSQVFWTVEESLLYGTTYYWRVADAHKRDTSDWAYPHSFTTVPELVQPQLILPANSTNMSCETLVTFLWDNIPDAQSYIFQVAEDEVFATIRHQETLTTNSTTLVLTIPNTTYYWRVQAVNDKGRSAWSETWVVNTKTDVSTAIEPATHSSKKEAMKVIRQHQLLIFRDGQYYDVLGNMVSNILK